MGARSLSGSSLVGFGSGGGKGTKDSSLVPFPPSRSPRVEHRDCPESVFLGGSNNSRHQARVAQKGTLNLGNEVKIY